MNTSDQANGPRPEQRERSEIRHGDGDARSTAGGPALSVANGTPALRGEPSRKKPYHKPAVRHERVFEVSALTCGKVSSTQASCAHAIKKS